MQTINTWSDWQAASKEVPADFYQRWQVFREGLPLLQHSAEVVPPMAWYHFYFQHIYPASALELAQVQAELDRWQAALNARLLALPGQLWRSAEDKLLVLAQWRCECALFLPLHTQALGKPWDSFGDWLSQLSDLERSASDTTLVSALRELRWQSFLEPISKPIELASIAKLQAEAALTGYWLEVERYWYWQATLVAAAWSLDPQAKVEPPALKDALAQLEQRLVTLRCQAKALWQAQPPKLQRAWLLKTYQHALETAQAQRAAAQRAPEAVAVFILYQQYRHLHWLEQQPEFLEIFSKNQARVSSFQETPSTAAATVENAPNKAKADGSVTPNATPETTAQTVVPNQKHWQQKRRQLYSEWGEISLRLGLNRRFGRGFLGFLDLSVGIATLALLLLFIVAPTLPPLWVLLLDTALCGVLLIDFWLRWSFAPNKSEYFQRNWLLGLLPALPFGLLLYGLEQLLPSDQNPVWEALRVAVVFLRQVRPLIHIFRIILLFFRSLDLVVQRYALWLNRNFLFFARDTNAAADATKNTQKVQDLEYQAYGIEKYFLETAPLAAKTHYQQLRLAQLRQRAAYLPLPGQFKTTVTSHLALSTVIATLQSANTERLERQLGEDFPKEIKVISHLVRWSPLRWLPPFHLLLAFAPQPSANRDRLAQLAWALGDFLQNFQQHLLFFADLSGVITPSQLVHRLGETLVQSLKVPRNRLLSLAIILLLISLLLQVLPLAWLQGVAEGLRALLAWPVLLLGGLAFLGVALGNWLKKIAHSQSEVYLRMAYAQFLEILEAVKERHLAAHYDLFYQRLLYPESVFSEPLPKTPVAAADYQAAFKTAIAQVLPGGPGSLGEQIYLWYRDYLDGAPLTRADHKITTQLLGNPLLQNLFTQVLRLPSEEIKKIQRLDLRKGGGMGSPGMWFQLITDALAHRVGALLDDYNRHAEPRNTYQGLSATKQARFQAWLQQKTGETKALPSIDAYYASYSFTALDFLTNDPLRQQAIAARFGQAVADCLQKDRQKMFREVFGSFAQTQEQLRTWSFNPYQWYQRYLRSGRFFLLPWYGLRWLGQGLALGISWLKSMLLQVLKPVPVETSVPPADFAAAKRKIQRFRLPVFLTLCRLRAYLDAEYLGLVLPGFEKNALASGFQEDLAEFTLESRELRDWHDWQQHQAQKLLEAEAFFLEPARLAQWWPLAQAQGLSLRQAKRYLSMAYLANYRDLATLATAPQALQKLTDAFAQQPGRYCLWWRPIFVKKTQSQAFATWWQQQEVLPHLRATPRLYHCFYSAFYKGLTPLPLLLAHPNPHALALEIMGEVLRQHQDWQGYLLSLRMLHSLAWLDYQLALYLVGQLGGYAEAETAEKVAVQTL